MSTDESLKALIVTIQRSLPLEIRTAPPSGEYLEGVLLRDALPQLCELLAGALGRPTKDFEQKVSLSKDIQAMVNAIGGIRDDQCLFLKISTNKPIGYAMLWPWASDPQRVTIKVGVFSS